MLVWGGDLNWKTKIEFWAIIDTINTNSTPAYNKAPLSKEMV